MMSNNLKTDDRGSLVLISFNSKITWRIKETDPIFFDMRDKHIKAIINPLYAMSFVDSDSTTRRRNIQRNIQHYDELINREKGEIFVSSDSVLINIHELISNSLSQNKADRENQIQEMLKIQFKAYKQLMMLLSKMKHLKKCYALPSFLSWESIGAPFQAEFISGSPTEARSSDRTNIKENDKRLALSYPDFLEALQGYKTFSPPIYEELLMDALEAFQSNDWRRVILYAAIAAESAIGIYCDSEYDAQKKAYSEGNGSNMAFQEVITASGITYKDPIYLNMQQKYSFPEKSKDTLYYITRRSFMDFDATSYKKLLALYKSRNKIAHTGTVASDNRDTLPLTRIGAVEAIRCVVSMFKFLEFDDNYDIPAPN